MRNAAVFNFKSPSEVIMNADSLPAQVELIIALPSLEKIPEIRISSQDMYFARGQYEELPIGVLLTRNPLFERVAKQYR